MTLNEYLYKSDPAITMCSENNNFDEYNDISLRALLNSELSDISLYDCLIAELDHSFDGHFYPQLLDKEIINDISN